MKVLTVIQYMKVLNTKKQVIEHYEKNLDFLIQDVSCTYDGKLCSKKDILKSDIKYSHLKIYYGKNNTKMTVLEVK